MNIKIAQYKIIIHVEPLSILSKFTQHKSRDPESGGIILGKVYNDRIEVLKLSVPTTLDKASRFNFERSKVGGQIVLDYEFFNSNGQLVYLGEWHTHPESSPTPSITDLSMLITQHKFNQLNTEFMLLIIKGTRDIYIRIIDNNGFYELKEKL